MHDSLVLKRGCHISKDNRDELPLHVVDTSFNLDFWPDWLTGWLARDDFCEHRNTQGTIRLENLSKLEVEQTPLGTVQSPRTRNNKFEMVTYGVEVGHRNTVARRELCVRTVCEL